MRIFTGHCKGRFWVKIGTLSPFRRTKKRNLVTHEPVGEWSAEEWGSVVQNENSKIGQEPVGGVGRLKKRNLVTKWGPGRGWWGC